MTTTPPEANLLPLTAVGAPIPYARREELNRPATASLIWGVMLFVPFLSGILAIKYSRRGLQRAEQLEGTGAGFARAGFVLGVINLVLSAAFCVALVPLTIHAKRQARLMQCASQLRQIGMAAHAYVNINRGSVPPDMDALMSVTNVSAVCTCPDAKHHGAPPAAATPKVGNSSYVYVHPSVSRMIQIPNVATTPLAYEPPANHGGRGMNVVCWDGHVEFYTSGPAMQKLQARIAAMEQAAKAAAPATPAGNPNTPAPAGPE